VPLRFPRRTVAVAAAVAAALTVSTPAMAAGRKPKALRFTAQGLVVASTPKTLRVLTRQLKVGKASLPANTVVTVKRPSGKGKKSNASLVGYTVTISGSAAKTGRTLTLAASSEVAQPQPAEVFLGVVSGVTPTGLTLDETSAAGGDDFGDDQNTLTVVTSAATVSVDGAAGTVAEDEFVIVLGERDGNNVVAATVDAYTAPPDVEAGDISEISGSVITFGDEWGGQGSDGQGSDGQGNGDNGNGGDDGNGNRGNGNGDNGSARGNNERHGRAGAADDPDPAATPDPSASNPTEGTDPTDGSDPTDGADPGDDTQPGDDQPTTVDLTNVPIVLNGRSTVDAATLTTAERIVVLGETDPTTVVFTPQIAFAFNENDRRPATHRHHHGD
jgi:hypothetical protein